MPPYSCRVPGQKAGHVLERDERNVEGVAEAHEPRAFHRRVDVERAGEVRRLVRDDADAAAAETREPDDDVPREVLVHLEELAVVDDRVHEVVHVVRLVRRLRHEACRAPRPRDRRGSTCRRRGGSSTLLPGRYDSSSRISRRHSRSSGTAKCATPLVSLCVMRAAELLLRDLLVRDRLDHVRPGHEHVARALDHDVEVGDRRRVDRAAGARAP